MVNGWGRSALCAALLVASASFADEAPPPADPYFRVVTVFVKGGANFYPSTSDPLGETEFFQQWGPAWGAGVGLSPTKWLTFEVAYEGSHRGLGGGAAFTFSPLAFNGLLRSGIDALVKLSLPLDWYRPFVGAGYGLGWVGVTPISGPPSATSFTQEVPIVGGAELIAGPLVLGARFTYRFRFMSGTQPLVGLGDLQATVGAAF